MRISLVQPEFDSALKIVGRIVSKNPSQLNGKIKLETREIDDYNGQLKISSARLETGVVVYRGARVEQAGTVLLQGHSLEEAVGALSPERLDIRLDREQLGIHLKCGGVERHIQGYVSDEYPSVPDNAETNILIEGKRLLEALRRATSPVSGTKWRFSPTDASFVFTDGRLAVTGEGTKATVEIPIESVCGLNASVAVSSNSIRVVVHALAQNCDKYVGLSLVEGRHLLFNLEARVSVLAQVVG